MGKIAVLERGVNEYCYHDWANAKKVFKQSLREIKLIICRPGKANQAVAAARFGGTTTFLGKIGQDTFGKKSIGT